MAKTQLILFHYYLIRIAINFIAALDFYVYAYEDGSGFLRLGDNQKVLCKRQKALLGSQSNDIKEAFVCANRFLRKLEMVQRVIFTLFARS